MKKVLIISYFFPPFQQIGAVRPYGLARHLRSFGWEPVVVTPRIPGRENSSFPFRVVETDYSGDAVESVGKFFGLNKRKGWRDDVSSSIFSNSQRNSALKFLVSLAKAVIEFPDNQRRWRSPLADAVISLLSQEHFDAVISTAPPVTAHVAVSLVKRKFPSILWISDFRDLCALDPYYPFGPRKGLDKFYEKNILRLSDGMVTVSRPLADLLENAYSTPVRVIMNGFSLESIDFSPAEVTKDLSIVYTGRIFHKAGHRHLEIFFKVLKRIVSELSSDRPMITVDFFGREEKFISEQIAEYGLQDNVVQHGTVSREEILNCQRRAQVLLFFDWNAPGKDGIYTGKIFEYLAAKRPILSVAQMPESVIDGLLKDTQAGVCTHSEEELYRALKHYYLQFSRHGQVPYEGDASRIMKYSHLQMAKQFASFMDELSRQRNLS